MDDPYKAPDAALTNNESGPSRKSGGWMAERVKSGQRILIGVIAAHLVIILYLIFAPILGLPSSITVTLLLAIIVIQIYCLFLTFRGISRISDGLGISDGARFMIYISIFIPLVNVMVLLVLNAMATRFLRKSGYQVGFLGAR